MNIRYPIYEGVYRILTLLCIPASPYDGHQKATLAMKSVNFKAGQMKHFKKIESNDSR